MFWVLKHCQGGDVSVNTVCYNHSELNEPLESFKEPHTVHEGESF